MERKIKFRGKRIDNGEWVYGSLTISEGQINKGACYICETVTSVFYDKESNSVDLGGFYEVDPATVGQMVYKRDEFEIYTGDKVSYWGGEYCFGCWEFSDTLVIDCIKDSFFLSDMEGFTVIGNIYDNSELLEV